MGLAKTMGGAMGFYLIFNAVFMIVYAGIGGFTGGISGFFSGIGTDTFGFLSTLFGPGGGAFNKSTGFMDPIAVIMASITAIASGSQMGVAIVGLLWAILPGFISALITGSKLAEDNSKTAFIGIILAIFLATMVPWIFGVLGQINPGMSGHLITATLTHGMYLETGIVLYLGPVIHGLFSGFIFAGVGAAIASNL